MRFTLCIYNTWDDVIIVPYGNLIFLCMRDDVGIVPYGNLIFLCKRDDVGIVPYEIVCLIKNQVYNAEDIVRIYLAQDLFFLRIVRIIFRIIFQTVFFRSVC